MLWQRQEALLAKLVTRGTERSATVWLQKIIKFRGQGEHGAQAAFITAAWDTTTSPRIVRGDHRAAKLNAYAEV